MHTINTNAQKIDEILNRGTIVQILPSKDEFKKKLLSGEKMRFYIGFDATAPTLHLSHAKNFILMEKFRELGHEVIILFGDFTARIGDPTGESATRKQLTREEVLSNVASWKKLVEPLMNFKDTINPPKIMYNHEWLSKIGLEDLLHLASNFTVQQILERDMFQKRMDEEKPIFLHEFMYPLMQGYDSVAMDVDVEMCGTDQIFNALVGRSLQKKINNKDKFVVAVTLMENPKTGELMSKSKGIGVFLDVSPKDMYGQVMAQPDEMIEILFTHITNLSIDVIKEMNIEEDPRTAKMKLAYTITALFHGEAEAKASEEYFIKVIQQKHIPDDIPEFILDGNSIQLLDLLCDSKLVVSKSDAKRLIAQDGIRINGEIVTTDITLSPGEEGVVLQKGKRNFLKIYKAR